MWEKRRERADWRPITAFFVLALALLWMQPQLAHATSREAVRAALDRVLSDSDIQQELPGATAERTAPSSPDGVGNPDAPDLAPIEAPPPSGSDWTGVLQVLFWLTVIAAALIMLSILAETLTNRRRKGPPEDADDDTVPVSVSRTPPPARRTTSLEEADRLAEQGRFAEAIQVLLITAIARIAERTRASIASSLTGREILLFEPVPDALRRHLGTIVSTEERSHFGARPVSLDDYNACRQSFVSIAAAGEAQES